MKSSEAYDPRSYERNFCNCVSIKYVLRWQKAKVVAFSYDLCLLDMQGRLRMVSKAESRVRIDIFSVQPRYSQD